mmetsp:Transcript_11264/g.17269  ORF Transcript_11264/g.17269 Transcript_11264/m.17269 type:complete len:170 (-) Transcript_11264:137-646(-)
MNHTQIYACLLLLISGINTQAYLFGRPRTNTASLIRRNVAATYYGELTYYTPTDVKPSHYHSIRPKTTVKTLREQKQQRTRSFGIMQLLIQMMEFDRSVHTVECYKETANDALSLVKDVPLHILNFFIKLFQFENQLFTSNREEASRESFFDIQKDKPTLVKHIHYPHC